VAAKKPIYKVRFQSEGRIYELYAREVTHGDIFGFVLVEDLVWGKKSEIIVDPTEQELKNEFAGVKRTYIPLHAVVRIDEVDKGGAAKVVPIPATGGKVHPMPVPLYPPTRGPGSGD
jgi:hypothetical protein